MINKNRCFKISASTFYNLSQCKRRVYMDEHWDISERGEESDFARMLWEKGVQIEEEIIQKVKKEASFESIEGPANEDLFHATLELMKKGVEFIYQGVLIHEDKIGRPDLLEKVPGKSVFGDYHYLPSDIKSGRATIREDSSQIKKHYANQMVFYCELLEKIQGTRPSHARIIDVTADVTEFDIADYQQAYIDSNELVNAIVYHKKEVQPVISATCKQCVWHDPCYKWAKERSDPTLLFYLGAKVDEFKQRGIATIADVRDIDVSEFSGKKKIKGVGDKILLQLKRRAEVFLNGKPIIFEKPQLRKASLEVYYDIEDDPSIDHIYLHGFIEVQNGKQRDYSYFLAPERNDEKKAALEFWNYIEKLPDDAVIYHYGNHEKTKANLLMRKYDLDSAMVEKFDRLRVDLYEVVKKCSDWPLTSYGIKPIAKYLGFNWEAEDASGANSIAWYSEYRKDPQGKKDLLDKIITYNKDDCEATIVVKEWLENQYKKQTMKG